MTLSKDQRDMLQTIEEHGSISEHSFRLTFEKSEEDWACKAGYVDRSRKRYRLTAAGAAALRETP